MRITPKTLNLKYFSGENLREKQRVLYFVMITLSLEGFNTDQISYWTGVSKAKTENVVSDYSYYLHEQDLLEIPWFKQDTMLDTKWFEKHQCPVEMSSQDEGYILDLLSYPITTSKIAREAIVPQPVVSYLRTGKRSIERLSKATTRRLIMYYKQIKPWASSVDMMSHVHSEKPITVLFVFAHTPKMIKKLCQKHIITKACGKQMLRFKHTAWHIYVFQHLTKQLNTIYAGVAVDDTLPNHVIPYNNINSEIYQLALKYSRTNNRDASFTDPSYIRYILQTKFKKIRHLHQKGSNAKQIANKLKLNQNFIRLVLNHKVPYEY